MEVEVKLFAIFREGRFIKKTINLSKASHISDVLNYLKILNFILNKGKIFFL